jgi:hypothetical protein
MKKPIIILLILLSSGSFAQQYTKIMNQFTNKWDYVINYNWLKDQPIGFDTLYVQYECDPVLQSGPRYNGDTIYIDTCYTSGAGDSYWDLINSHLQPSNNIDSVYANIINTDTIYNQDDYSYTRDSILYSSDEYPFVYIDTIEGCYALMLENGDYPFGVGDSIDFYYTSIDMVGCADSCNGWDPGTCNLLDTVFYGRMPIYDVIAGEDVIFKTTADLCPYIDDVTILECITSETGFIMAEVFYRVWDTVTYPVTVEDDLVVTGDIYAPNMTGEARLGYVVGWEHTNGHYFPVPISQLMDTGYVAVTPTGYWDFIAPDTTRNSNPGIVDIRGNLELQTTTSTVGQIKQNGTTVFHTYSVNMPTIPNLFIGRQSGNFTTTGLENIGIGTSTLLSITSGN